jgi:hypothetical protein
MYSLKNYENIYLSVSMIFQSLMGPRKSMCDVPNGTIQEWACPFNAIKKSSMDSSAWR